MNSFLPKWLVSLAPSTWQLTATLFIVLIIGGGYLAYAYSNKSWPFPRQAPSQVLGIIENPKMEPFVVFTNQLQ